MGAARLLAYGWTAPERLSTLRLQPADKPVLEKPQLDKGAGLVEQRAGAALRSRADSAPGGLHALSRLDRFITRMQAQRALLDHACDDLNKAGEAFPGPVIELGLGNGRTYDHLREHLRNRRIVAFDRRLVANPKSVPPAEDLFIGEIQLTAPAFAAAFGRIGTLVHADLGNGVPADDRDLESWLPGVACLLAQSGALVIASTALRHPELAEQPTPGDICPGPYHVYRRL